MATDLILLHAPSVYDFRKKTILYGPVSDLIPPSPVFEMYPIGLTSIAEYLETRRLPGAHRQPGGAHDAATTTSTPRR